MNGARSFQAILILVIGTVVALWLGVSIVTQQSATLIKGAAVMLFAVSALLGRRIWLLLIFFSAMNVVLIRGFGTTEIGQAMFLGFSTILFLMRKLRMQLQFKELELWALLIVVCIVQTYLRNPVGLNLMGSGNVGGKPYIMLAISISCSAILSVLIVEVKELKWAMWLTIIGTLIGIPGTILRYGSLGSDNEDLSRVPVLSTFATMLSRVLVSRISPLRACIHPGWIFILLLSAVAASASGYRNSIAMIGLVYLVGICYRGGVMAVFSSLLAGSFGLVLIALINLNFPLPGNIQRALSPFPGTWEEKYKRQADLSTEWRVEMWKEALTSDRWIHNKLMGDGLGMSQRQLRENERVDATMVGAGTSNSGLLAQQENMLINGSYHSGPVHTIRTVGYLGLLILLLAMVRLAVHAHRQILRCKGTEWFTLSLFFNVPILVNPIFFTFIFGEFPSGVASTMMGIAIVRLLEKNLPIPAYRAVRHQPYMFANPNRQPAGQPARA
jgi:hypothetical protein